jgi:hexulose-6-phosphate isomerase
MKSRSSRREFLQASVAATAAGALPTFASPSPGASAGPAPDSHGPQTKVKKAVLLGMFPKEMKYAERFQLAKKLGFEGVEAYTTPDEREAEEIKEAADAAGVRIHSVMNMGHWEWPLSSADADAVKKSMERMRISLRNAKLWGADAVLLVPAVVNAETSYKDAWTRSQARIRELIPLAEELKVVIAVEEVWNKFLLSPLEFIQYLDEFKSPWVKAYVDVGNMVLYGYPHDWIRTAGKRIVKIHLKDFKIEKRWDPLTARFVNLGDGDVDWKEVRQAFVDVDYSGFATVELDDGDEAYLRDVSQRVDRLVLGKP